MYDNFEELLSDSAEEHRTQITQATPNANRTVASFNRDVQELYTKYVDQKARNIMFKYLPLLKKPRNCNPSDHVKRMKTLFRYANKLPGTAALKTEDDIKEIIFDSFPDDWTTQYNRSGRDLENETMAEVVQFMKDEKNYKDNEDSKKKSHNSHTKGNHKKTSGKRNNEDSRHYTKKSKKENPCRYHDGHHEWKCWTNQIPTGTVAVDRHNSTTLILYVQCNCLLI